MAKIKITIQAISRTTRAALKADPAAFIDTGIIDQLLKEGFSNISGKGSNRSSCSNRYRKGR